jgi:regulator of replication initiation timing
MNLESSVEAIVAALAVSGIEATATTLVDWIKKASQQISGKTVYDSENIRKLAEKMSENKSLNLDLEISRRNLSRWFEIPEEEFAQTPKAQLEPEILIRHIALENIFKSWFSEWNYEIEIGEELEGLEDIEFIPDIYAKRVTLHGIFEVIVCFVCDNPPSIYRTRSLFETFESYARSGSAFGERDIFIMATPFKFGKSITQSISLQNKEEKYCVIALEGDDIARLDGFLDPDKRLMELRDFVERAQHKTL